MKPQFTIEEIRKLLGKVTAGEWFHRNAGVRIKFLDNEFKIIDCLVDRSLSPSMQKYIGKYSGFDDAEFISQSKNIVEFFLDKVEELEKENSNIIDDISQNDQKWLDEFSIERKELELRFKAAVNLLEKYYLDLHGIKKTPIDVIIAIEIKTEYQRLKRDIK